MDPQISSEALDAASGAVADGGAFHEEATTLLTRVVGCRCEGTLDCFDDIETGDRVA